MWPKVNGRVQNAIVVVVLAGLVALIGCNNRLASRDTGQQEHQGNGELTSEQQSSEQNDTANAQQTGTVNGEPAFEGVPLSQWRKRLDSKDATERKEALRAISGIGPAAKDAIPEVRKLLQDPDEDVQEWACAALGRIGEAAKVAIPDLEKIILNPRAVDKVRWAAAVALGNIGPAAASATPTLIKALQDSDPWLRWAATEGLSGIGPEAQGAAQALAEALYDSEYIVRIGAARALVHLAPQVKKQPKVMSALIRCYEDNGQYDSVRQKIAEAIRKADPVLADKLRIP